jgi:2-polyprenyl-6-hydroxyphenyl methylase/3-demethylubiquinone-9 3-methyltransferase
MNLWGVELPEAHASAEERRYLSDIARRHPQPITLEQMWTLTDAAWDACGASTDRLDSAEVRAFYRHPVWLVNGVFADVHDLSRSHREALAQWVAGSGRRTIVDFGGGYGALARRIAARMPGADIRVVDPFPSALSVACCAPYPSIRYVPEFKEPAGVLIAQDVLEHVADPVGLTAHLVQRTEVGGCLVFANHFAPSIKCHVPATFHLERTFPQLLSLLGCEFRGRISGCEHALVFERVREKVRSPRQRALFERYSRARAGLAAGWAALFGRGRAQ